MASSSHHRSRRRAWRKPGRDDSEDDLTEDEDDVDYVVLGTPLENEDASNRYRKRKKSDPATARQLPLHLQQATDDEGRRRFHGAFTGGFSAGYYNTVGSAEGFTPKTFTSSRGKRAEADARTQDERLEDFLDEDEIAERKRMRLESTRDYDTFASRSAREAKERAEFETRAERDRSAIPGGPLLMDAMVEPVSNSIGIRMLLALGWRRGKGIGKKPSRTGGENDAPEPSRRALEDSAAAAAKALTSTTNTPIYVRRPKENVFGLGYDPYALAADVRERRARGGGAPAGGGREEIRPSAARGGLSGIGYGVFDEDDKLRVDDVYGDAKTEYNFEIVEAGDAEDEKGDVGGEMGRELAWLRQQGRLSGLGAGVGLIEPPRDHRGGADTACSIEGFEYGGCLDKRTDFKWFKPPTLPRDFDPKHTFAREEEALPAGASGVEAKPNETPGGGGGSDGSPPRADPPKDPKVAKTIDVLAAFVARNGPSFESLARERNCFDSKFNFLQGGQGAAYYKWKKHQEVVKARRAMAAAEAKAKAGARPQVSAYVGASANPSAPSQGNGRFTAAMHKEVLLPQAQVGGLSYPKAQPTREEKAVESERELQPERRRALWQPEYLLCKRFGVKDPHNGRAIDADAAGPGAGFEDQGRYLGIPPQQQQQPPLEEEGGREAPAQVYQERPTEVYKAIFSDSEEDEEQDPRRLADAFLASL